MDFREFEYMLAVAEQRSVTKAARELHISQPALSHYIRGVEEELGVKLFDRSTSPMSLTFAGERYVESARRILMEGNRLMKELRDINQHMTGRLRIGTSRDRASYMMPRLLPRFCEKYPGIEVEVYTQSGQKLTEALIEGRVDLLLLPATAITLRKHGETSALAAQKIYTDEMLLAARAGTMPESARLAPGVVRVEALADMDFFLMYQEHAARSFCDDFFRRHRIRPKIRMEFASNISSYRMAAAGMGVTIVPYLTTRLADAGSDVELFSLGETGETWDVMMFYRKDDVLGAPERDLLSIAREVFANERLNARTRSEARALQAAMQRVE